MQRFGHTVIGVFGDSTNPPFAYTIGLTESYSAPELLVFGLRGETAPQVINGVAALLEQGRRFADGELIEDIANVPLAIKSISRGAASEYAKQVLYWYEEAPVQPTFMQLVLPDRGGRFPWQDGYDDAMRNKQPELWGEPNRPAE